MEKANLRPFTVVVYAFYRLGCAAEMAPLMGSALACSLERQEAALGSFIWRF